MKHSNSLSRLLFLLCLPFMLQGCKISYEHQTTYPSASDRIISPEEYKYFKSETFYFNASNSNWSTAVSGMANDMLYFKDGSFLSDMVTQINEDSVTTKNGNYPTSFISNINFGNDNPSKENLKATFEKIAQSQKKFITPTYYSLDNHVKSKYSNDCIFANAVWDVMVKGMKRRYVAVSFDIYQKR